MPKAGYVYILASERNGTLYVGVTNDLVRRVQEHRRERNPESFTARYDVKRLVYHEHHHDDIRDALKREKRLKGWKRQWKLELIEGMNLHWRDLYPDIAPSTAE
jgi:putative endonuclease